MKIIKVLELFGGIGAIRKALINQKINFKVINYIENNKQAVQAYNLLYNDNYPIQDIKTWEPNHNDKIDLLMHGSPCQDFSMAGKRNINTGRSILYLRTLEIIKQYINKPEVVIWENVLGLTFKKNKIYFDDYLETMQSLGYTNYYQVLNAIDFGIPQSRRRIFVISIYKNSNLTFNFNNLEKIAMQHLYNFININENNPSYFIKQPSLIKALETERIRIINPNDKYDFINTITTRRDRKRGLNVHMIKINKILLEVNSNYKFKMSDGTFRKTGIIKETGIINIPYSNNHLGNQFGVTSINTITTQNTKIIQPVEIPIFKIQDQFYHLRVITEREALLLMGFTENDYNKIKIIPKTHLYRLAGNSIVIPVLEAILKELYVN